jgi:hypothetical protein
MARVPPASSSPDWDRSQARSGEPAVLQRGRIIDRSNTAQLDGHDYELPEVDPQLRRIRQWQPQATHRVESFGEPFTHLRHRRDLSGSEVLHRDESSAYREHVIGIDFGATPHFICKARTNEIGPHWPFVMLSGAVH